MGRKAFAAVDILEARLNDKLRTGSLNTNTNINADMASEDVSMTPQPPTRDAMEQIEDGDDAAPCPFNFAEFEDEPRPKIELCEESTDEGDTLLLSQQRDSSGAKKMAETPRQNDAPGAASINCNESLKWDPILRKIGKHKHHLLGMKSTRTMLLL
jgi:hypothetical protein